MDLEKRIRLQALLDLPDKYDEEEMNRTALKPEKDSSGNISIFDYLEL